MQKQKEAAAGVAAQAPVAPALQGPPKAVLLAARRANKALADALHARGQVPELSMAVTKARSTIEEVDKLCN